MAVNDNGKYTKLTPEVVNKLEQVFSMDGTVDEACYFADISRPTYYAWIKANPDMEERFNKMRERPVLLARQTVMKRMGESYFNAMDYLKRKKKLEFADRIEHTGAGGGAIQTQAIGDKEFEDIVKKYADKPRTKESGTKKDI